MSIADTAARMVADHGETMVLSREGEATTISLKGKRLQGSLQEGGNSATRQEFRVKIGTAELLASAWATKVPSADTDSITVGGVERTILDVRPLVDQGTTVLYDMTVS